jgi:phytoene desaturase
MTRAAVIGAGPAGLACGLRLQAAGIATTVIEARPHPGGRLAAPIVLPGMATPVDSMPVPLADVAAWRELWMLAGADLASEVPMLPVAPVRRLNWPDGTQFDWSEDHAVTARAVSRLAPGDLAGFEQFLAQARDLAARRRQPPRHPRRLRPDPSGLAVLARNLPDWLRGHGWRSLGGHAGSLVRAEKLRQALSLGPLLAGRNPLATSATYAAVLAEELDRSPAWPQGGLARLASALAALFTRLGGELRLGDPATRIETLGNRATGVTCASGWSGHFDCVASTADPLHTAHALIGHAEAGARMTRRLRSRRWTPACFTVHFALAGAWPGIAHDTVLFPGRWADLLGDIHERGVLPTDMVIRLLHPTVTDPTLAPAGQSLFTAQVPVANLGMLPIDWEATGPLLQRRVLDEIGRRLVPDIHDRILAATHRTPRDDALDYNAAFGSAAGPEPGPLAELRPEPRSLLSNLWFPAAGAGATPASALAQARITANRIIAVNN